MDRVLKILFVPRWYPSRIDPMPGLFIQRQAEALAKEHSVQVISVHPDPLVKKNYEIVHTLENSVNVCRVYYKIAPGLDLISKLINTGRYIRAHHHGYMSLMPFSVDVVHGHILTREIFFTWFMARKQGRPYLISEHWSRYFQENGTYRGVIRKWLTRFLLNRSAGLIVVSKPLAEAMKAVHLVHPKTFIVPNVVDVSAFVPLEKKPVTDKALILHVSCFEEKSKNIKVFLDAIARLLKKRDDFRVRLVGEGPDHLELLSYAGKLGLCHPQTEFTGIKINGELIRLYQTSSFLVQTSRYETFGTVIIEALACGIPVVSTRTGIADSVIGEDNGILIQQPSVDQIMEGIEKMLDIYPTFDYNKLHESVAGSFSDVAISGELTGIYNEIIKTWQKD
ncbi:MAG: glycosyltransferase [Bacteroidetes bacterium]|nr:glycosyltransferase [Bacteroidota bacterium]